MRKLNQIDQSRCVVQVREGDQERMHPERDGLLVRTL